MGLGALNLLAGVVLAPLAFGDATTLTNLRCSSNVPASGPACSVRIQATSSTASYDQHRPRDWRQARIQVALNTYMPAGTPSGTSFTTAMASTGLFKSTVNATTPAQFSGYSGKLAPGTQLILTGSKTWNSGVISFRGEGTEANPIIIRPDTIGGKIFGSNSRLVITGNHVIVFGFEFKSLVMNKRESVVRLGSDGVFCNNCIFSNNSIYDANLPVSLRGGTNSGSDSIYYLSVSGRDNTVANSSFRKLLSIGQFIDGGLGLIGGYPARLHIYDNYFAERPQGTNANGFEVIQIGGSQDLAGSTYAYINGNLFENCYSPPQDTELVTIKGSDVIFRNNTFKGSHGGVVLMHSRRSLIEGNIFLGANNIGSGVRIMGDGHWIVNNYFSDNKVNNLYYYPIIMRSGTTEWATDTQSSASRVREVMITNNTFVNNLYDIGIGLEYNAATQPYLPLKLVIANNLMQTPTSGAAYLFQLGSVASTTLFSTTSQNKIYSNNFDVIATNVQKTGLEGLTMTAVTDNLKAPAKLAIVSGLRHLTNSSPALNAARYQTSYEVNEDADAQARNTSFDIGSDEHYPGAPYRQPLTSAVVGYRLR